MSMASMTPSSLNGVVHYLFLRVVAIGSLNEVDNLVSCTPQSSEMPGQVCDSNLLLQVGGVSQANIQYERLSSEQSVGDDIANTYNVSNSSWASVADRALLARQSRPAASHEYCEAAWNDKNHLFHGMWSQTGIIDMQRFTLSNGRHTQHCWEGMRMTLAEYFFSVRNQSVLSYTCKRNWRAPQADNVFTQRTAMILGNDGDIIAACGGNGDCQHFNMHMLFLLHPWGISHWNMCRNFEFVSCGAMGGLQDQDGGLVFLASAPKDMNPLEVTYDAQLAWMLKKEEYYSTPPITLMEICLLDQMCSNYNELFTANKGDFFRCNFDEQRFFRLQTLLG